MPVAVRELELDLDAFEGPFDLLLSLVLREELPLREVDLAEIVIAFVEHLAEKGDLDLDACGEFLVLISALLELRKQNEIALAQSAPFAPIRISRADAERSLSWSSSRTPPARSA